MSVKKILTIAILLSLIMGGSFIALRVSYNRTTVEKNQTQQAHNPTTNHSTLVQFRQENLQLHDEVVQFALTFHHNDVINVSLYMYVSYVDETITSNFFLLTDGKQPLLQPLCLCYVPERKYALITPRIRFTFGKFWLIKFLNERQGRLKFGSAYTHSTDFVVHAGDTWYLTLAVPTTAEKSGFSFVFKSLNGSFEVTQLTRHSKVGLYAAEYNQFSGRYYAVKLSLLGAYCICNVNKEIRTTDGSIVHIVVAGHRRGSMVVYPPSGGEIPIQRNGGMSFGYIGNLTGSWRFTVKGWSLWFMMFVVLLYIDIDPHVMLQGD